MIRENVTIIFIYVKKYSQCFQRDKFNHIHTLHCTVSIKSTITSHSELDQRPIAILCYNWFYVREMKITVAKGGFDFSEVEGKAISLPYDTLIQLIEQLKVSQGVDWTGVNICPKYDIFAPPPIQKWYFFPSVHCTV